MADRTTGTPRQRIKTITQAALNADVTLGQVEALLTGLGPTLSELNGSLSNLNAAVERLDNSLDHFEGTLSSLDDLARRLVALIEPVEAIVERIDYIVNVGETMMSPFSATEHVLRGFMDTLRRRTGH